MMWILKGLRIKIWAIKTGLLRKKTRVPLLLEHNIRSQVDKDFHGQNSTVALLNSSFQNGDNSEMEDLGNNEDCLEIEEGELAMSQEVVEINLLYDIENKVVQKLGDIQLSHTESM